ncbi:hypothetical protein LJC21_04070 [Bacteroides sp. OttesenSCG-928-E20]|nr:hypothetical protein [Bacteroides sp. OttesenSCG-928-E20]MDL2305810.1 hypothetical protein [Bacteroides sp. OttesenSCG-928-D19]
MLAEYREKKNEKYKAVVSVGNTTVKEEHILSPDEDLKNALTAQELLVGIEEDIKALFVRRRQTK